MFNVLSARWQTCDVRRRALRTDKWACPIYLAFSITMLWLAHQGDCSFFLHCRSTYYVDCRCLCGLLHPKKKTHTREMQLLCRFTVGNGRTRFYFLAELYLLLMMDWSLRWGFLVGFCEALCFSVSRNSVSHACTAILRLVHDSDSGRASVCANFGIFFRFSRFSPFAEEGFMCLDHSAMSKKKKRTNKWAVRRKKQCHTTSKWCPDGWLAESARLFRRTKRKIARALLWRKRFRGCFFEDSKVSRMSVLNQSRSQSQLPKTSIYCEIGPVDCDYNYDWRTTDHDCKFAFGGCCVFLCGAVCSLVFSDGLHLTLLSTYSWQLRFTCCAREGKNVFRLEMHWQKTMFFSLWPVSTWARLSKTEWCAVFSWVEVKIVSWAASPGCSLFIFSEQDHKNNLERKPQVHPCSTELRLL